MKKFLLWLLMVVGLVAVVVFGTIGYVYYNTDENEIPVVTASLNNVELTLNGYSWNQSVLKGFTYKKASAPRTLAADSLGVFDTLALGLSLQSNINAKIAVKNSDGLIFQGNTDEFTAFTFEKNGDYTISIELTTIASEGASYGSFYFDGTFSINVQPKISVSESNILQGGVICIVVSDNIESKELDIKTDLGLSVFTKINNKDAALIPVAYNREPGKYVIDIRCGDNVWAQEVTIIHRDFIRQDMTISNDVADSTANSAAANYEFNQTIVPIYSLADKEVYWNGLFKQPVEGRITSEYGLRRYTNGAKTPVRHGGIDIATALGTPIVAPNNGKVLYAGFLQLTGNTVVIEHGGGLKSYFYHMDSLSTQTDAMITTGEEVGKVGTTGYSTGPHLHYEVKIGNQSIDPWQLFNGTSGIFYTN